MSLKVLYAAVILLAFVAETGLFAVLIIRRQYKVFPVFTLYIGFNLLYDVGLGALTVMTSAPVVRAVALSVLPLQYLLELMVLLEIGWNVLRPVRTSLPRGAIRFFIGAVMVALVTGALLAWKLNTQAGETRNIKGSLDLTVGLLCMLIFVATAGFAQVLGIGWKNKVLQLTTALCFYGSIDLIVTLVEHHFGGSNDLESIRGGAYVLELIFLVWAFTTKDVERREFSPQMEQFLVTLAGRARHARTALVRMQVK
jgi:hypothetical protein